MPELPEVETIRLALAPAVTGRRVVDAHSHPSAAFAAARDVVGATITGVDRRGKYLLVGLDDDRELVVHLGMTGSLGRARPASDDPYVRARWRFDDDHVLELRDVRRFGRVVVVPAGDHRSIPTLAALGPEPLGDGFTAPGLYRALRASRRRVKTQLLSQRPVAGIGNIYADEALWRARVHPATRRVSRPAAGRLHEALRAVLRDALGRHGTTLRDYRTFSGEPGRNQAFLDCYGRAGEPCRRCRTALRHRVLDGRGTTWCPVCQPR